MKKILSIMLVLVLVGSMSAMAFAGNNGKGKGLGKTQKSKTTVNEENDDVMVEEQIEAQEVKNKKVKNKKDKVQKYATRKQEILSSYTEDELLEIEKSKKNIEKRMSKGMKVLPVNSIISNRGGFKFDTPPVIKNGRTIIPVRAITEGFGAIVDWDGDTKTVTITKDDTIIELPLDSNIALVNGLEVELDSNSEILNSRTYVPLRFISETLGLNVEWDEETETIELGDTEEDIVVEEDTVVEEETTAEEDAVVEEDTTVEEETTTEEDVVVEEDTTVEEETTTEEDAVVEEDTTIEEETTTETVQ